MEQKKQPGSSALGWTRQVFPLKYFVETLNRKEEKAFRTENIYPTHCELGQRAPLLAMVLT
ncbi:MAG: hypothetical protein H5U05_05020 [Candidatus Aminicenantes bacterium]|nr:hypothetical protein [Candidatus Aminicenantes bacterium]